VPQFPVQLRLTHGETLVKPFLTGENRMAERVPPLSSAQVTNLNPDPTKTLELVDGAVPGLRLRVTSAGARSWSLNIRAAHAPFLRRIGVGLAEARKKAGEGRRQIREGADPTAECRAHRARASAAELGIGTFRAVIDAYFSTGPGGGLRSKQEQLKRLRSVFAAHLARPALDIDGVALQLAIDAHIANRPRGASATSQPSSRENHDCQSDAALPRASSA
jgi:hypothetical protein